MDPLDARATVVLVRHAQSEWNATGRWQGHADPPLTPRGEAQARALGERMAGERVSLLLCSDLRRTVQTAQPIAESLGLAVATDPRLRELDVGSWSGLRRSEIESIDPETLARFEAGNPAVRPGGGESRGEIRARAHRALAHWISVEPHGRIVIVTHLGFIRALLPGEEPENTGMVEVSAREALTRRRLHDERVEPSSKSL